MKKIFQIFFVFALSFLFVSNVFAGSTDNVWGYAWSENIGWISFNCDPDGPGAQTCSGSDYGVNIETGGCFKGYAWSENIGWISFDQNQTEAPPSDETSGDCLAEAYQDSGSTKIRGWARVLSGKDSDTDGFDGWIKFNGTNINLSIDNSNPREFLGWGWSDVVNGWISFNSKSGGGSNQYAVYTSYESAIAPGKPENFAVSLGAQCSYNLGFSWTYIAPPNNDSQKRIQIEVSQGGTVVHTYESSVSANNGETINIVQNMLPNLNYNTDYDFRIRTSAQDSGNVWSPWSDMVSFKTHPKYPDVNFNLSKTDFELEELITLANNSSCDGDDCSWQWRIQRREEDMGPWEDALEGTDYKMGEEVPGDPPIFYDLYDKSPQLSFSKVYNYGISLAVTDIDLGITCSSDLLETRPQFEEIKDIGPEEIELINFFGSSLIDGIKKSIPKATSFLLKALLGLDFFR